MDDHVLVDVALTHVSYGAKSDLLKRRHICESHIDALFDFHELACGLILLVGNQLGLHCDETLLEEL